MRAVLLVFAHLDDAVLTAGQFVAGRPDAVVATVFAGIPSRKQPLTAYDAKCGFESSAEAVEVRRQEDIEALSILQAKPVHMDFLDLQYKRDPTRRLDLDYLNALIDEVDPEFIVGPLGLVHGDHQAVRDAVLDATRDRNIPVWLAEDLPYRVTSPMAVIDAFNVIATDGLKLELGFIGTGSVASKMNAIFCYRSQMALPEFENRHELLVGERFWQVKR